MTEPARYKVNSPKVIHEIIDGEVIIVNLDSGSYYGLEHVGARVWEGLAAGGSVAQVVEDVAGRYDADAAVIEQAVVALVTELEGEGLIAPRGDGAPGALPAAPPAPPRSLPFAAPALHKYTDMQELLLLDPVHEVDETGWPKAKLEPQPEG